MKTILVTGGTGYIGSHTVVELVNAGFEPVIVDSLVRSSASMLDRLEKLCNTSLIFREGSCCDREFMERVFTEFKIDGVIHFAAFKAVGESVEEPLLYYQNNINGLLTLIETMQAHNVRQLVFSSSCTVYGNPEQDMCVYENTALGTPNSPYGWTKWMAEQILRDCTAAGNLDAVLLRYFNPIGAHPSGTIGELPIGRPNNIVPFITQTAAGLRDELTVFGSDYATTDGTCVRDYIHVTDIAQAHIHALVAENLPPLDVFNLGTGKGTSVLELIHAFEEVSGKPLNWSFGSRRPGDVSAIYANADKAKSGLGWEAKFSVKDALADAWRWEQNRLADEISTH